MSSHIAIATSAAYPGINPDDAHLIASLDALGVRTTVCVWNNPTLDWTQFNAVVFRSTWDYFEHYVAFLAWLDQLERMHIPTINPMGLVRWNSNKRYLLELEQLGVEIIPTRISHSSALIDMLGAFLGEEVVVKPIVSGGAWHTVRGVVGSDAFHHALSALPSGDYLLQPFVHEIVDDGEWSLLFFGGEFSHAVIKRPASGDYRVQGQFGGSADLATPSTQTLDAAKQALDACATLGYGDHIYVRVDGVVCDGRFLLMEMEMIEPFLHLAVQPDAAERYAALLALRLAQLKAKKPQHVTADA